MEAVRFKIAMLNERHLKVSRQDDPHFYPHYHYHQELQLTAILQGFGTMMIGTEAIPFRPGDLILLGANVPHLMQGATGSTGDTTTLNVYFKEDLFGLRQEQPSELKPFFDFLDHTTRGLLIPAPQAEALLKELKQLELEEDPLNRVAQTLLLLNKIKHNPHKKWLHHRPVAVNSAQWPSGEMEKVYGFSMKNLHRSISLEEAAAVANLSASRFSRNFKKHTGLTYIEFLHRLRVETACGLLLHTTKNVQEIAFLTGFNNLSNFNKTFKTLKQETPTRFRLRLQKLQTTAHA